MSTPSMNLPALVALWNVTQQHVGTSGARAAAGVLLGLYNGERFPFDLTDLRVLDAQLLICATDVISRDAMRCEREVHEWLNLITGRRDFGQRFEHLAHEWKRKGKCKREGLEPLNPPRLVIKAAARPQTDSDAAIRRQLDEEQAEAQRDCGDASEWDSDGVRS
jgi:hypothetical protein